MIRNTSLMTIYGDGTFIMMDHVAMKMFLENLAITTIVQCREMIRKENMGIIELTTKLPYYDDLVDKYCSGVHGAVLENMLCQNANILYSFVQDCVLNNTVRGLYLLQDTSRTGKRMYELILMALDEYTNYIKKNYDMLNRAVPSDVKKYNEYNKRFEELMINM